MRLSTVGRDVRLFQLVAQSLLDPRQKLLTLLAARFNGFVNLLIGDGIEDSGSPGLRVRREFCPCPGGARWGRRSRASPWRSSAGGPAGRCSRVRMLCRRSASLIRTTRMSSTMASIILRRFSACCSSRVSEINLADLGDAFDDVGYLLAELLADVNDGDRSVLDRVVQQAGGDGHRVHLHFGREPGRLSRGCTR